MASASPVTGSLRSGVAAARAPMSRPSHTRVVIATCGSGRDDLRTNVELPALYGQCPACAGGSCGDRTRLTIICSVAHALLRGARAFDPAKGAAVWVLGGCEHTRVFSLVCCHLNHSPKRWYIVVK